ncbi:MAG: hypothetical protein ACTSPI_02740 [Candidatus Heimdallarchaeaceae archaeon]
MKTKKEYKEYFDSLPDESRNFITKKALLQSLTEIQFEAMKIMLTEYKSTIEQLQEGFDNIQDKHLFTRSCIQQRYSETVIRETSEMLGQDTMLWYNKLLEEEECVLCESKLSLHFHHVNPATKDSRFDSIPDMINANCTLEEIRTEMNKCIVVCRECHLKKIHRTNRQLKQLGKQIQKLLKRYSNLEI